MVPNQQCKEVELIFSTKVKTNILVSLKIEQLFLYVIGCFKIIWDQAIEEILIPLLERLPNVDTRIRKNLLEKIITKQFLICGKSRKLIIEFERISKKLHSLKQFLLNILSPDYKK